MTVPGGDQVMVEFVESVTVIDMSTGAVVTTRTATGVGMGPLGPAIVVAREHLVTNSTDLVGSVLRGTDAVRHDPAPIGQEATP